MSYTFNKVIKGTFEEVKAIVIAALKEEKFGLISEIDMQAAVKSKLDKDMQRYEILGACSPKLAYDAVMLEEDLGVFLPCNIVLNEKEAGEVKVSIIAPIPYLQPVENPKIKDLGQEVSEILKRVFDNL